MMTRNIIMSKDGVDIYPVTKSELVVCTDGMSIEDKLQGVMNMELDCNLVNSIRTIDRAIELLTGVDGTKEIDMSRTARRLALLNGKE